MKHQPSTEARFAGMCQCLVYHWENSPEGPCTQVIRRMTTAEHCQCQICPKPECTYASGSDGQGMCLVTLPGLIPTQQILSGFTGPFLRGRGVADVDLETGLDSERILPFPEAGGR